MRVEPHPKWCISKVSGGICIIGNNTTDLAFFVKESLQPGEKAGAQNFEEFAGGQGANDGERTSTLFRDPRLITQLKIHETMLDGCDLLFTDGHMTQAALPLVQAANQRDIPVIADAEEVNDDMLRLVSLSSVLIAPEVIVQRIAGNVGTLREALNLVCEKGPSFVVATRGSKGSACSGKNLEYVEVPAAPCNPVDTTGAGDTFHAGFVIGMKRGMTVHDALVYASKVAAANCECLGARLTGKHLRELQG